MEKTIEDLKLEADTLGITYSGNIGIAKLQEKIDAFYEAESKTATIAEVKEEDTSEDKTPTRFRGVKDAIRQLEIDNAKTEVVKLTMIDKREASTATDAYFSNGNYAMRVPLDVWVEMPKILIDMAEKAKGMVHMETDMGSIPKLAKKYVVEYKNR